LKWFAKGQSLDFNYLTFDQAFEYAVLEYPFSFWQWGSDCQKIPSKTAELDTLIQHFVDVVGLEFYSDKSMEAFGSHYYQSGTEMGYYGFEIDEYKHLIKHLDKNENPTAIFMPEGTKIDFDATLTNKVFKWTQNNSEEFIYINGALDTWSATAVPEKKGSESLWFFMADKHHANARINNLEEDNKNKLISKLNKWLELDIKTEK